MRALKEPINVPPSNRFFVSCRDNCNAAVRQCPVPESCLHRTLGIGTGASNTRGTISSARERSSRSGTWWQYGASPIGSNVSPFNNDPRSAFDVRLGFYISFEEMIAVGTGGIERRTRTEVKPHQVWETRPNS
jgi:hypothetical protein